MGKFISNNQLLGSRGETFIRDLVLRMGHVFECIHTDAGLDGTIELRDSATGEMLNLLLRVQVKSTTNFQSESSDSFSFTCDARDIEYWLKGNTPNILVVCNPQEQVAYWKSIRDYFSTPESRKKRTVRFSKVKDVFDATTYGKLFELARPTDSGLYMEAPQQSELLTSNLLRVKRLPKTIHIAPTNCRSIKEVYAKAGDHGADLPPEILLYQKTLISIHDFREEPVWRLVCEHGASEAYELSDRFDWNDLADRTLFAEFLFKCFKGFAEKARLRYSPKDRTFYSPLIKQGTSAQTKKFHSSRRDSARMQKRGLVTPLGGKAKGFRHCAFSADFEYIEKKWFMQISPTYFYTSNGWRRKINAEEFLTKIKQLERNKAVFSQLRLWEEYLCEAGSSDLLSEGYPHLEFGPLEFFNIERAVPDDLWYIPSQSGEIAGDKGRLF